MDFYSLKRKQLQALCKKHGLPANRTNLEMAETLIAYLRVNGDPTSNEKDPNDAAKKFRKVRFSPENETREYEPSIYRMPVRRSRRRSTLANPDLKNSKQSNLSDKIVGKKRGRGNKKIESVSRITRSQAKVDKETSSLIENETETIRSQDGCEKVLQLQEPLKGLRRNAARKKCTASQKEEVSETIDRDSVEARKGCRRSTRNVGKCTDSEFSKVEVVARVTRSKLQSAGNVSEIESEDEVVGVDKKCKGATYVTNELMRSTGNSSRLTLVATSNEMNEIGGRDGKIRLKRKREVVQEIESSTDVDESLVGKPPRRSTRHTLKSDIMGPSEPCKSVEKKQKRSSRMSIITEETTLTNILSPNEDAGVTMPVAAGEKDYSSSNKSNALKSYQKKGESKSKSRGKRSNASVDVSALHSGIGEEIDAATNLEEIVAATPIKLVSTEQEESTVAGLSVVSGEKNIGLVDDTGILVSDGSNESGADYQSSHSFKICANLDGHDLAQFKSAELHMNACDAVSLADGLSCLNQSAFPDECPNRYELEKGIAREVMSKGKDASYGSDCINDHSTEVDRISIHEDDVCGMEITEPDSTKDEIEHEVLPDNGKLSSAVREEIFAESTEGVCLESDGVNDRSTEVDNISVQEDGFSSPERTEQDNTTDKNEHKLVPRIRKASPDVLAESAVEDTKNIPHESDDVIEHSTPSKREFVEKDGVSGLERTKQDDTTYELSSEAVPQIGKGSLQEDGNVFSPSEYIVIQFSEEGNACNATNLSRTSCTDEYQDGKGICQFNPEEKDCNEGQNGSATTISLKSPHTGCTTAKDNDENQQAFVTGLSFCGGSFSEQSRKCHDVADEETIMDNSNCEDEKDAQSQFYLEELEDGKMSNTAIAKNSINEVFCQQDFEDCMAGKKDVGFDSNDGKPFFMEALSEPSNQELSSQTTGQESEFSAGKNVESMAQSSKHINRIDRMEERKKYFERSDSQSQVNTFEKFVGDHFDEEATPEARDGNLFYGICENSDVADKETCMITMDMQAAQNGVALQSNCTEEPGKSNIVIVNEVASIDFENIDKTSNRALDTVIQLEGNAVELFNVKEKSEPESETSDFVDLDMDVKAADASEKVGKMDRSFKCKDTENGSDREFEKITFSSHDVSSNGNSARDYQEVVEEQVKVQQGSVKEETFMNEIDCLTLNKISCENKGMNHSTEGEKAHCLHKFDDEMLTIVESKKAADFEKLDGISPFKSEVVVNCKTTSAVCASPSPESEALELNLFSGEGEEFEVEKPSEQALQVDLISEDSIDLLENAMITKAATRVSEDHNGECTDHSSHGNNARDHLEVAEEEEVKVQQGSVKEETSLNEIDCLTLNKISCDNRSMIHSTEGGQAHCLHKLDNEILTIVEPKKAADFEKLDGTSPFKSEVVVNCKTTSTVFASPSHESEASELDLFFGEGEEFEVEKPSEQPLQVDLISKDAGDSLENAMIPELAATQVSEDHNGERTYLSSHGNNARDQLEVAKEEEVEVQQGSIKEETLLNEIVCLTLNKISCENRSMIHSTEGGQTHCLHKLDDEILTIVESKKTADFEKLNGISPFRSQVVNCKTTSAVCVSPSHGSEGSELIFSFGEGEEFEVEKPSEQALQVDLISEDAGELPENAMITEQAATQVFEDHNDECKHQMDEELPKNVMITGHAATQASEDHNCECVHQMYEELPKNVMITESAATRVAEDQHDECENQMEEVAKLKHTYLAISDEPDFELAEESKMQENALTEVDYGIQGSTVYELQENESVRVEAKAFHVASTPVEKVSECEASNLKQDNISKLIVENVEEAMELIENLPETGATTVDESLVLSSLHGVDIAAGDGQSCQGKLQAPKKTSSYPGKEEEFKLNREQLVCSMMKIKSNITGLIQETPQKGIDSHLMKENPPSIKMEQIGKVTAPKTLLKRRALEDLRNN